MKVRRAISRKGRLILVTGGASSGKSAFGLQLAGTARRRAFVATGQALDPEMAERIQRHRASRAANWQTAEVPIDVAQWFRSNHEAYDVVVVDCLTLWLMNLQGSGASDGEIADVVSAWLQTVRATSGRVIVVTNELGMGLVPVERSARHFRELAGRMNQQVAQESDEVYMVVSGMPVRIKPHGSRPAS